MGKSYPITIGAQRVDDKKDGNSTIDIITSIISSRHTPRHTLLAELDTHARFASTFSQQIYANHELGRHRRARGLAPQDSYPYTETEIAEAHQTWLLELIEELNQDVVSICEKLPKTHADALLRLNEKAEKEKNFSAIALRTQQLKALIDGLPLSIDATFHEIQEWATAKADAAQRRAFYYDRLVEIDPDKARAAFMQDHASVQRLLGWSKPESMAITGLYARMKSPEFWMRGIQKRQRLASIQAARILQMLGRGKGRTAYLPTDVVRRAHQQIDYLRDWMERTTIKSQCGRETNLATIVKGARARQLAELDIRAIAQYERIRARGWAAFLVTVTTPSRYHPTSSRGVWSAPNPRFMPTLTANDSVEWMQKNWILFRSRAQKICRDGWDSFGALEGHADATGHRHILIYCPSAQEEDMKDALLDIYLESDSPDEPGARTRRVKWEPIRSEGGAKKYITKILRYTTKTLEDSDKPSAEALYARAIGRRSFSLSHDKVGLWRWLRACPTPYHLPEELIPAWAAAHGLGVGEIPAQSETAIHGEVTRPHHYVTFLGSVATEYEPAWREEDFFYVTDKTIDDFRIDPETGEVIDDWEAMAAMQAAWAAAWDGDDSLIVKSKVRIKNKYGDDKMPSGGAAKAPAIFRRDMLGRVHMATRPTIKWTKETTPKVKAGGQTAEILCELVAKKSHQLQLSIQSQGAAARPETRSGKGFDDIDWTKPPPERAEPRPPDIELAIPPQKMAA